MLTQDIGCEHKLAAGARFIVIGIFTGFISALFAAGGAPVVVFGLLWFCRYGIKETIGPSLATLAAGAIVGFCIRFYLQSADLYFSMAMMMLPFGIAGVIMGNIAAKRWSCKFLQECFSCFVIFIGMKMTGIISLFPTPSVPQEYMYWLLCGIAAVAGFGSRMLGTGGGLLTVPVLMYAGITLHQALITSLCLNIPMMLLGASLNFWSKPPPWKELRPLVFGAVVGASIGAYVSYMYVPDALLQMLFGGLLVVSATITMFPRVFGALHIRVSRMRLQRHESTPIRS